MGRGGDLSFSAGCGASSSTPRSASAGRCAEPPRCAMRMPAATGLKGSESGSSAWSRCGRVHICRSRDPPTEPRKVRPIWCGCRALNVSVKPSAWCLATSDRSRKARPSDFVSRSGSAIALKSPACVRATVGCRRRSSVRNFLRLSSERRRAGLSSNVRAVAPAGPYIAATRWGVVEGGASASVGARVTSSVAIAARPAGSSEISCIGLRLLVISATPCAFRPSAPSGTAAMARWYPSLSAAAMSSRSVAPRVMRSSVMAATCARLNRIV